VSLSVLLAGGGTAGHVAPLLATAAALRRRDAGIRLTVLGTADGLEARLVPQAGLELSIVPRVPLPRRPNADLLRLPGRLAGAVGAARRVIEASRADVVVGFGGYVCPPAYLAARRAGVPIVVHEANAKPGLANRLGARLTRTVAVTFPGTPLPHAVVTGMPLRPQITGLDRAALRPSARAALGLEPDRTTLLVFGGSLGAQRLNRTFAEAAPDLVGAGVQVLHATGRGKHVEVSLPDGAAEVARYVSVEYLDRMDLAFAAADAIVCRAGASTVSEISALGLPAAYVPLPIGNGEQRLNAEPVVAAGGGLLVADDRCTAAWVRATLLALLADPLRLAAMGTAAARVGIRDGDERLADLIERSARAGGTS